MFKLGYVTVTEARTLLGYTTDDISDSDLQTLIDYATELIIEDLTLAIRDEEASGNIDGSNTTFEVDQFPIADTNGDKVVTGSDVTVYQWVDKDDPATKSTVPVSTIHPREGIIVLSSPPASTIEAITVDYSYTWEEALNWDLIKVATSYLVGYLFSIKKFTILPESIARGPIRIRHYVKPYDSYLLKYNNIMKYIKSKRFAKKTHDDMGLARGRLS